MIYRNFIVVLALAFTGCSTATIQVIPADDALDDIPSEPNTELPLDDTFEQCNGSVDFLESVLIDDGMAEVTVGDDHVVINWVEWNEDTEALDQYVRFVTLDTMDSTEDILLGENTRDGEWGVKITQATPDSFAFMWREIDEDGDYFVKLAELDVSGKIQWEKDLLAIDDDVYLGPLVRSDAAYNFVLGVSGGEWTFVQLGDDDSWVTTPLGSGKVHDLVWTGEEFGIFMTGIHNKQFVEPLRLTRLSSTGESLAHPIPLMDASVSYMGPRACWDGEGYAFAFDESDSSGKEVFFGRMGTNGKWLQYPEMVSEGNGRSWAPSISCNGPNYGLSWQSGAEWLIPDSDLLVNYIAFAELDGEGNPLVGPQPVEVTPETFSMLPTVVHRDGAYWVSWSDWGEDGYDARLAQSVCIED